MPACSDTGCLLAGSGLVHQGHSVWGNADSRTRVSRSRACNARVVVIVLASLTTTAVVGRILAVFERTHQPFLFLTPELAMCACLFELGFLWTLSDSDPCSLNKKTTYLDQFAVVLLLFAVVARPRMLVLQ
jgi:hypothetical protein